MTLGEWLAREREALGLSQRQLADECGVPQSRISELELGRRGVDCKMLTAVLRIAASLNLSPLEAYQRAGLLDFEDDRDRDAVAVAQLVAGMDEAERREAIEAVRAILERRD